MTTSNETRPPMTRLEVKIAAEPCNEDAPVVGPNVKIWGRIRNGPEVGEWFLLPAKSLEISVMPHSFAIADIEVRADVVEIDNMRALVQEIEIQRESRGTNGRTEG